ncbi:hypothetical protein CGCA056_v001739 [Colletotrichum aenigma]|uniref:uncharacterized protein n=1 Tax=Colletotrichum aenigma TaxID=1215731 RepID=UPI001872548A|nr:uncharacterized protein CGCA056_v001739 [Colletotrichum aenigma]KAF5527414.1 hypothetical protein CGCA056_v001739 [Colletotrichum aenigma]
MSFGIGIGDCVLILRGLVKCWSLLRGEAVNGVAEHAEAYKSFCNGARSLRRYLKAEGRELEPHLDEEITSLNRLLKDFLARIKKLQSSLGEECEKKGFGRIVQKMRWPLYDKILSGLCQKLSFKFDMIKFIVDLDNRSSVRLMNLCPPAGLSRPPDLGPKFVLVDARSEYHGLSMAGVKSWDDLATFIDRVFCVDSQSCLAVKNRSYILRNNTTEEMVLLNSPCIPPWEDSVKDGHELEMSMLFPDHTDYNSFCPKCKKPWSSPLSVEMFCTKCGLSARFLDFFDNEPDPVTSLALKDIRRTGLRVFFEETMLGIGARGPPKMKNQEMPYEQTINALIKCRDELGSRPVAPSRNNRSGIKDFRRITFCSDQWPDLAKATEVARSSVKRLRAAIQGLKRYSEARSACFPMDVFASLLNSRILDARRDLEMKAFFKSIVDAFSARQTLWMPPAAFFSSLEEYIWCARDANARDVASVIRLRCLLWTYEETLALDADLKRGFFDHFSHWAASKGAVDDSGLLINTLFGIAFSPHALVTRLTVDVVADIVGLFREGDPVHILACLPLLIKDSAELVVMHILDGNLAAYFRKARTSRDSTVRQLNQASKEWLESTIESRGETLVHDSTFTMVYNTWSSFG